MSWMPATDPLLGDKRSCDALELVIVPRVRDLGDGFSVRRALPHGKRQMVGPFIEDGGVKARVIAGSAFGRTSPVGMLSEWLYAEVVLAAGASAPLRCRRRMRRLSHRFSISTPRAFPSSRTAASRRA